MFLYIGGMPSATIAVWKIADDTLQATQVGEAAGLHSPSFFCFHPVLPLLYAVERSWDEQDGSTGALVTFRIDPDSGGLERLHRCRSGGAFTAHVSASPDGRFLATASPRGPSTALFALDDQGIPAQPPQVVFHEGRGAKPRQAEPWPHSAYFTSDTAHLLACDLGLDKVSIFRVDRAADQLVPAEQAFAQVSSGAGARHLAIAADGATVYVANELDSTISVFRFDPASASMWVIQTIATVPDDALAANQPAEILLSADGRQLFVSNRGLDTIAVFAVLPETGRLQLIRQVPAGGKTPRHAAISPDGRVMAVSNQASNHVRLFHIGQDGLAEAAAEPIPFANPTCARLR